MSRRADYTLILVTERIVLRCDFSGADLANPAPPVRFERHPDSRLIDEIQRALDDHARPARRVAVLATGVWNQLVSIPGMSIESLDSGELAEALKYEVEPLVGIEAPRAAIGFTEIPESGDQRKFWVNVTEQDQWNAIRDLLVSRKAREICLAHPVAVSNISGSGGLEFWDKGVFRLAASGSLEKSDVLTTGSTRWISELGFDSIEAALADNALLTGPETALPVDASDADHIRFDLDEEASVQQWLRHAALRLSNRTPGSLPLIQKIRPASRTSRHWLMRVASLLVVVGFCGWHLAWLNGQSDRIGDEIAALKLPGIEKQKYDAMLQGLMEKRELALAESIEVKIDLQKVRFFFENQPERTHTLLEKLVELRTSKLVIKKISVVEKGTLVSGVSLDSDAAPLLTNRLRDSVSSMGWKIHPASQDGQLKMVSGGPWTYSILLEDIGPPGLLRENRGGLAAAGGREKKRVRP